MKKMICLVLAFTMALSMSTFASAAENEETASANTEVFSQNYNVTTVCPWERISTYGVNPPTEGWNISTEGTYYFSGSAAYSRLYLSKLIYGSSYYAVTVTNNSTSNTLTVNPHDGIPAAPFEVEPSTTTDPAKRFMQKSGTTYFSLSFEAPSNFEGSVSEWIYQ